MEAKDFKKYDLPDNPGVYFFLGGKREILYIGKATSLRDRVKSYFNADIVKARGPKIMAMLEKAVSIKYQETDSVLEALLLETELIKKNKPTYNTREKDDKSYWYVVITKEDFPRVLMMRGKDLVDTDNLKNIFGPFPSSSELKVAMKLIREIFPFRDKCVPCILPVPSASCKPCFNRQIGLCPGVCTGEINKADYGKIIRNLNLFFQGKKSIVVKNLEKEMKSLAKAQKFEQALDVRNRIFAINHIRDVALLKNRSESGARAGFRIEAYDIAHTAGTEVVGVMTVVTDSEPDKDSYRKFKLSAQRNDDVGNLRDIVSRRLAHPEWPAPNLVVVDGGKGQYNVIKQILFEAGVEWPVVAVVKDERHRPRDIMGDKGGLDQEQLDAVVFANHEAHRFSLAFHRQRRGRMV